MNKKFYGRFAGLLLSGALLVGCGNQANDAPVESEETETENVEVAAEEITFDVEIVVDGESIPELAQEISTEEGIYLSEIMEENYDVDMTDDGFMLSIEGYDQDDDEGLYWMYYVNDESAPVGAAEYSPEESDLVEWRLESFE